MSKNIFETKYDFNHIDPVTGMPRIKQRAEDKINLMNMMPNRSGWIIMLQNRVNFNSVGNKRYSETVWYDRITRTVSTDKNMEDGVDFRQYRLPNGPRPAGWIYKDEYQRLNEDFFDEIDDEISSEFEDSRDDEITNEILSKEEYKHNIAYLIQCQQYSYMNDFLNGGTFESVLKRLKYTIDNITQFSSYKMEVRTCVKTDYWPSNAADNDYYKDNLRVIEYNENTVFSDILDMFKEKIDSLIYHRTITLDINIEYNLQKNITLEKIKSLTLLLYQTYVSLHKQINNKFPNKAFAKAPLIENIHNKNIQPTGFGPDEFKQAFTTIAKKEYNVNRATKDMSAVCNTYKDSIMNNFKMPQEIIDHMNNNFRKKNVYKNLVKYVSSTNVEVVRDDNDECFYINYQPNSVTTQNQCSHIVYYVKSYINYQARDSWPRNKISDYKIVVNCPGKMIIADEVYVKELTEVNIVEVIGSSRFPFFEFIRNVKVNELIMKSRNAALSKSQDLIEEIMKRSKNPNVIITFK